MRPAYAPTAAFLARRFLAGDTAKGEAFADIAASLIKEAINRPSSPAE